MVGNKKRKQNPHFYYDEGGDGAPILKMSFVTYDHVDEYIPVDLEKKELVILTGLYELAPDAFRTLLNHVVQAAEMVGRKRGL